MLSHSINNSRIFLLCHDSANEMKAEGLINLIGDRVDFRNVSTDYIINYFESESLKRELKIGSLCESKTNFVIYLSELELSNYSKSDDYAIRQTIFRNFLLKLQSKLYTEYSESEYRLILVDTVCSYKPGMSAIYISDFYLTFKDDGVIATKDRWGCLSGDVKDHYREFILNELGC